MSTQHENLVAEFGLVEFDLRRAELLTMQLGQAATLRERGILTNAYFKAIAEGDEVYDDSSFWACVFRSPGVRNFYGVQFIANYADGEGELTQITRVVVCQEKGGQVEAIEPFDESEARLVADFAEALLFERDFGDFQDLGEDLTGLVPPSQRP